MPVYYDRIKENFTTTGTSDIATTGAVAGYRPWGTLADGDAAAYCAEDPVTGAWEIGSTVVTSTPAADSNFANVAILAHFNGANLGTTFTNEATMAGAPTLSTSNSTHVYTSTAQKKFGTASARFPSAGSTSNVAVAVHASASTANNISTGDFTVEAFVRLNSHSFQNTILDYGNALYVGGGNTFVLKIGNPSGSGTGLYMFSNGGLVVGGGAIAINTWTHIALSRASGTLRAFIDGTVVGTVSNSTSFTSTGVALAIGGSVGTANGSDNYNFNGYIDEFRFTVGVGRHTASFTPPNNPYGVATGGGSTLTRTPLLSSNSNAAVSFAAGTKQVFLTAPASVFSALPAAPTITTAGTTGARTINSVSGTVNFAAAAASLVVTNSLVTAASVITCTVRNNDSTMKSVQVVAASGSFTLYPNAAPTAETSVGFFVIN